MKGSLAARRYAKSLLELSLDKNIADAINDDMQLIGMTIAESADLENLLQSPIVKAEKKGEVLSAIFGGKVNALTNDLIKMVTSKGRESILPLIAMSYIELFKEHKKVSLVEVSSATALTDEQKTKITEMIAKKGITNIEMVESVNPDLIGGFVVRFGDQQIDASVARKLSDLRQELVN